MLFFWRMAIAGQMPSMLVHVRLLHPLEELAGVGRQRLDVAPLPFGIDRVEGERRLARTADAGHDDERPRRQREVDVLQVVGTCAANDDLAPRVVWHVGMYGGEFRRDPEQSIVARLVAAVQPRQAPNRAILIGPCRAAGDGGRVRPD